MKRVFALVFTLALVISAISVSGIISFAGAADEGHILFYSSFDNGNVQGETTKAIPLKGSFDSSRTENVTSTTLNNWFNFMIDSVEANTPVFDTRSADKLFDNDNTSSYMTNDEYPIVIKLDMKDTVTAMTYSVTSANNANANAPMDWTFEGSDDGGNWTVLNTVAGQTFAKKSQTKRFILDEPANYPYYRMVITKRAGASGNGEVSGSLQFAELSIKESMTTAASLNFASVLVEQSAGPSFAYAGPDNKPWKGESCVVMTAKHNGTGRGYGNAYIFQNLNILVTEDTYMNYVIFPDFENREDYDFEYTSQYAAVDLMFTDGTYLSDLGALDQNGHGMSARAQGESKSLYAKEWNFIETNVGKYALGKTISKIVIVYDKPQNGNGKNPITYFDDIKIYTRAEKKYDNLVQYVDTRRGSNDMAKNVNRGLIYPATCVPNAFNLWTPSTTDGARIIYNYHPSDSMKHLMITHQASYHLMDYGVFMFMPNTNQSGDTPNIAIGYRDSRFDHDRETANANYYSVVFDEGTPASGVRAEMTPTDHAGIVRMTFPEDSDNVNVILDSYCSYNGGAKGSITFNDDGSFEAYVDYGDPTWNIGYSRMFVYGEFSRIPVSTYVKSVLSMASFAKGTTEVEMRIATSYMSIDQAKKNLEMEVGDASFEEIRARGDKLWNDILSVVEVEGATEEQRVTLYSNLYRMYVFPTNYSENIGSADNPQLAYTSPYKSTLTNPVIVNGQMYTTNGFWDTYRTAWAAYDLLTPVKAGQLIDGFVQHYKDSGWVGRWLNPGPVNSMCGTSSDVIFADACVKGIEFDYQAAYESAIRNSSSNKSGNCGRINNNSSPFCWYNSGNLAWTMESAINDYGIAQMAKKLGYEDDYEYYTAKAKCYVNNFNSDIGFFLVMRIPGVWYSSLDSGHEWKQDTDPRDWDLGYCETNAWGTAFAVTQDAQGLAYLYGGKAGLAAKLDALLAENTQWVTKRTDTVHEMYEAREVRMGQYQHSNQPAHHILYMYSYANQPYKTQALTREVLDRLYVGSTFGQGYLGDEDNGEMSAWYVLSALGFYPMNMGSGEYVITSPLYPKAVLHLPSGDITITAENNSSKNVYIQSLKVDGEYYGKCYITHQDLLNAKNIEFVMGDKPSSWATDDDSEPTSITAPNEIPKTPDDISKAGTCKITGAPSAFNLFDDSSTSVVNATGELTLNFTYSQEQTVEMITVTSGNSAAAVPKKILLYGSSTGEEGSYVELISSENPVYLWANTVKPYSVKNPGAYKYYRLVLQSDSSFSVGEVELLANFHEYKEIEKGDVNCDGTVDVADALAVLRLSMGFAQAGAGSVERADMNGDGRLTVVDAMYILRKAAGLDK